MVTVGSFTDLAPITSESPHVVALGLVLGLGAIVTAGLAVVGSRYLRPVGLAWGCVAVATGVVARVDGHDSGLAVAAIGALTLVLLLLPQRADTR